MVFPTFLPNELKYASPREEDKLLEQLKQNALDFVTFFGYAAADETWSDRHQSFMQKSLTWLTVEYFLDRLDNSLVQRVAQIIQNHYSVFKDYIPTDIMVKVEDETTRMNSLLLGASSNYIHERLRLECMEKNLSSIEFKNVPKKIFKRFKEFIQIGKIEGLWKLEDKELLELLKYSTAMEMNKLSEEIADFIKRYFTPNNILNFLLKGFNDRLKELNTACIHYINNLPVTIRIPAISENGMTFEFLGFSEEALDFFNTLHHYITQLICQGNLSSESLFTDILRKCPKLIGLDISHSYAFPEALKTLSLELENLDISKCEWLTDDNLKEIITIEPKLVKLSLASNTQLTFRGLGDLQKLKNLHSLDISRCIQINDDDFKLILKACQDLTELLLDGCKRITDVGFIELVRKSPRINRLGLSRTTFDDRALAELISHCFLLESLDLTRCVNLTDKGIMDAIRNSRSLREINVSDCAISSETVQELKKQYPFIHIIFED